MWFFDATDQHFYRNSILSHSQLTYTSASVVRTSLIKWHKSVLFFLGSDKNIQIIFFWNIQRIDFIKLKYTKIN